MTLLDFTTVAPREVRPGLPRPLSTLGPHHPGPELTSLLVPSSPITPIRTNSGPCCLAAPSNSRSPASPTSCARAECCTSHHMSAILRAPSQPARCLDVFHPPRDDYRLTAGPDLPDQLPQ